MKIKNIDKETKNTKMKYLLPIAKAGLSLGLTAALINTGIVDYDAMLNWEKMSDIVNNMNFMKLPGVDINIIYGLLKTGVTTFGMNTLIVAGKGLTLTKEVIKPIVENEKVQNNPTVLKIKEVFKGKNKDNDNNSKKQPKALVNLAQGGLALGFKTYMIATGQIDYNSAYDLTKLPHKFVGIAQVAEKMDLNKVKIGMEALKIAPKFISERKQEKEEGIPIIPKITFKDILSKISKEFPTSTKLTDLAYATNMDTKLQTNQIETITKEEEDRQC